MANIAMAAEEQRQERRLNRTSERMSQFHEYFKAEFLGIYELADGSYSQKGLSLKAFLNKGKTLAHHLTLHHTIEEQHFFPLLAKKMPQFSQEADGEHLNSHKKIHDGLDELEVLLKKWTKSPSEYSPAELRASLDSWREVLFQHLDQEVADLRGENLRKYFTVEEIEALPI